MFWLKFMKSTFNPQRAKKDHKMDVVNISNSFTIVLYFISANGLQLKEVGGFTEMP